MKINKFYSLANLVIIILLFTACSEKYLPNNLDEKSGLNGDFEIIKNDYPSNWKIHAIPVNKGLVKFVIDQTDPQHGNNALKLVSSKVKNTRKNWKKPGLSNSVKIEPGKKYKLSIWLKNENSDLSVKWISSANNQSPEIRSNEFIKTNISFPVWYYFKEEITAEENENLLTIEIVMNKPGIIWIDNIKFEEIKD